MELTTLQDIKIGRGETVEFQLSFPDGEFITEGEKIVMTIRKDTGLSFPVLIEKVLTTENEFKATFTSDETRMNYGLYVYDFWYVDVNNNKQRLCLPSRFIIQEVVGNV